MRPRYKNPKPPTIGKRLKSWRNTQQSSDRSQKSWRRLKGRDSIREEWQQDANFRIVEAGEERERKWWFWFILLSSRNHFLFHPLWWYCFFFFCFVHSLKKDGLFMNIFLFSYAILWIAQSHSLCKIFISNVYYNKVLEIHKVSIHFLSFF